MTAFSCDARAELTAPAPGGSARKLALARLARECIAISAQLREEWDEMSEEQREQAKALLAEMVATLRRITGPSKRKPLSERLADAVVRAVDRGEVHGPEDLDASLDRAYEAEENRVKRDLRSSAQAVARRAGRYQAAMRPIARVHAAQHQRPRTSRGSAPRHRGSRRPTATRAGPDDPDLPHEHLAASAAFQKGGGK